MQNKRAKDPGRITKLSIDERKSTFKEVSNGFAEDEALIEASRCLQCKDAPCNLGCPAGIDIRGFIKEMTDGNYAGAISKIKEANTLPGVCGRVCPQEDQCQKMCILAKAKKPIQIGYLERFMSDWELALPERPEPKKTPRNGIKIAVIGAGPAGITCAADLAKLGYEVHLLEALHKTGGVLVYGIPEFRLPKDIVQKEVAYAKSLGVIVRTDFVAGRTMTLEDLRADGFKAFYIAVGAGLPRFMNIPGENLNGVYSANEFLTRVNLMKSYRFPEYDTPVQIGKKAAIFGGGNVAFDCARSALRLGAEEVHIVYRRTRTEMPAREEEIENAEEEGIIFDLLATPLEILSDGRGSVSGIRCIKNELGEPDASGRRSFKAVPGSEFVIEADSVLVAVGTSANPLLIHTVTGLEVNRNGYIEINSGLQTSIPDVFAGGDIVSGSATVISAIESARKAAHSIHRFLSSK